MSNYIKPGGTIGILGGGQLGRFLSLAASRLGYRTFIFCPDEKNPASQISDFHMYCSYEDKKALKKFSQNVDVVTFEFENVPVSSLEYLENYTTVRPKPNILEIAQNRTKEKKFFNQIGSKTTKWLPINSLKGLRVEIEKIGYPSILKTSRSGYDGKGQCVIRSKQDIVTSWNKLFKKETITQSESPLAILEKVVDFDCEISVIVSRDLSGNVFAFEPTENLHKKQILLKSVTPAKIPKKIKKEAINEAKKAAIEIDLIGIMALEMFVVKNKEILINEMAPRPHNSGHWTLDACSPDQFTQQIKCICGLMSNQPIRYSDATMINLLGNDIYKTKKYLNLENTNIYYYGKETSLPKRKMGHVTSIKPKK
ncbi:MAG: 5-(carboxyamino)imidazole ribonucleotide synthase [Pseudomonadota bacterium]|nr:5-(carboxyamino)imidazole ribonucleotide synthase [Pseudomonadota bacterium]